MLAYLILFFLSLVRNFIIEERSFGPCEDLKYGRMSFKGFNTEVEVLINLQSHLLRFIKVRLDTFTCDVTVSLV